MILSEANFQDWKSIKEADELIIGLIKLIICNSDLKKKARLKDKRYPFKMIFEEYLPLVQFAKLYCNDENIEIRYAGLETQKCELKYDGEIKLINGEILTIEIAYPIDGGKAHKHAMANHSANNRLGNNYLSKIYTKREAAHGYFSFFT